MSTDLTPAITDDQVAALPLAEARADLLRELLASTATTAGPVRRSRRWLGALAVAAAVAAIGVPVGLTQLGDDAGTATDRGSSGTSGPRASSPAALQVRVVTLTSDRPQRDHPEWQTLASFSCPDSPATAPVPAAEAELACDSRGAKYLLEPAAVAGGVTSAEAALPQGLVRWVVEVHLDDRAAADLADLTEELVGTARQVAFVVDGNVLSAPTIDGVISGGVLQLTGDFTEADATELAARLSE